jgi:Ca-activated chloride channel family protein
MSLTAPSVAGDHELRYITGSRTVLARRPIKVAAAQVSLSGPDSAVAGTTILITWTGPNNKGDYITIVPADFPDGRYGNYTDTSKGSPMNLLTPIMAGPAELRYMTGQGANVLARRAITITAAQVTLSAPAEVPVESDVSITWTGPDNPGDYITIVPKSTPDGQYGPYTLTTKGSPLTVKLPKTVGGQPGAGTGDAEVRYMTGQGNKVLARIPIKITP